MASARLALLGALLLALSVAAASRELKASEDFWTSQEEPQPADAAPAAAATDTLPAEDPGSTSGQKQQRQHQRPATASAEAEPAAPRNSSKGEQRRARAPKQAAAGGEPAASAGAPRREPADRRASSGGGKHASRASAAGDRFDALADANLDLVGSGPQGGRTRTGKAPKPKLLQKIKDITGLSIILKDVDSLLAVSPTTPLLRPPPNPVTSNKLTSFVFSGEMKCPSNPLQAMGHCSASVNLTPAGPDSVVNGYCKFEPHLAGECDLRFHEGLMLTFAGSADVDVNIGPDPPTVTIKQGHTNLLVTATHSLGGPPGTLLGTILHPLYEFSGGTISLSYDSSTTEGSIWLNLYRRGPLAGL